MKKFIKKTISFFLIGIMALSLSACGQEEMEISDSEAEEGYVGFKDLGFKFKMGDTWKEKEDNIVLFGLGNPDDENEPMLGGIVYGYISNDLIDQYYDAVENIKDEDKLNDKKGEIFSHVRNIFAISVFKKNVTPKNDEVAKLTTLKNNVKINEKSGYTFYFSYEDFDDSGLSEEDKKEYKALYDDMKNIQKSITTYKPVATEKAADSIKNSDFAGGGERKYYEN